MVANYECLNFNLPSYIKSKSCTNNRYCLINCYYYFLDLRPMIVKIMKVFECKNKFLIYYI